MYLKNKQLELIQVKLLDISTKIFKFIRSNDHCIVKRFIIPKVFQESKTINE